MQCQRLTNARGRFREQRTNDMTTFNFNNPEKSKSYREITVFNADNYYKEIHRAQRGYKSVTYAINDTENPYSCFVVKDGYIVAKITVELN